MRTRESVAQMATRVADDFPAFCYDGFGVMLDSQQIEAHRQMGHLGPRTAREAKFHYLSGGQRGGKTVYLALSHCDAGLYKRGVDTTDQRFWRNYLYKLLAGAPSNELALRLYVVMDELSKGASDAQRDRRARRARGGRFLHKIRAGKATVGQTSWPTVFYDNGAQTDFRTFEGRATRLEGGQWWGVTYDEWMSQPDHEIKYVMEDVLMGRGRDHDAKIWPAAWPKQETERHLMRVIREIESQRFGLTGRKAVTYISAENAYFTNKAALDIEREMKDDSKWKRTVLGRPAGGSSIEFKVDVIENAIDPSLPVVSLPDADPEGYRRHLVSWDLGLAHDDSAGTAWSTHAAGVMLEAPAIVKEVRHLPASETLTLDHVCHEITMQQRAYGGAEIALDAQGIGGVHSARTLERLTPRPHEFKATAHHRLYGNLKLAAITNGIEMLTWGRDPDHPDRRWGLVRMPRIPELVDQLAYFDRDAKDQKDDLVWSFLIGLWYIRRWWVMGEYLHRQTAFDPRIMRSHRQEPFLVRR